MNASKSFATALIRSAVILSAVLMIGCGDGDGPVRGAGSIDIPEAALKKFTPDSKAPQKSEVSGRSRSSRSR